MKSHSSAAGGLWGLAWRSVALLPVTTAYLVLLGAAHVCVPLLPLAVLELAWNSEWARAALCAAAWLPALLLLRWSWRRESSGKNWGAL